MKNVLVIYSSKYGSTKRYAENISNKLEIKNVAIEEVTNSMLSDYSTIIFGFSIYAGMLRKKLFLKKNAEILNSKKVIVFTSGITPLNNDKYFDELKTRELDVSGVNVDEVFHFRGNIDYKKLSFFDSLIIKMIWSATRKKTENELTKDDKKMLDTYGKVLDYEDMNSTNDLINYVRGRI